MTNDDTLKKYAPYLASTAMGLALMATAPAAIAQDDGSDKADDMLEEITVTASRRSEGIQSIPYNISAMSGRQLEDFGAKDLTEISRMIPGIQFIDTGARQNGKLIMRGLSDGPLQAAENQGSGGTVSRYLDETPLTVDFKLFDIERVEVLRGPQGTLYGRGAMGGTLRYITNKPQLGVMSASADVDIFTIKESASLSTELTGVINVPGGDNFALRVAVNHTNDSGFVDYVNVHTIPGVDTTPQTFEDQNGEDTLNLKIAALLKVSDEFSVSASYYMQDQAAEGRQAVNPEFTGDKYSSALRYLEPRDNRDQLLNLELTYETDTYSLVSNTSFTKYDGLGQRDQTDLLIVDIYPGYANFPEFSSFTREESEAKTWIHETRYVSNFEGPFNFIAGVYYQDSWSKSSSEEFTPGYQDWAGIDTGWGETEYLSYGESKFSEIAAFTEMTYDVSDKFHVTVGARVFEQKIDVVENCFIIPIYYFYTGQDLTEPGCEGSRYDSDTGQFKASDTTLKINMSYDISDDVMVYATVAEGFRSGGVNFIQNPTEDEKGYTSDGVVNYELGWHTTLNDGRMLFNGAVYYIDWTDIQVDAKSVFAAENYTTNGGKATVKGIELESKYAVSDMLTIGGSYTYTDARIGEGAEAVGGVEGNKLAGVPANQFSAFFTYTQPLGEGELFVNGSLSYRGKTKTRLNSLAVYRNDDQVILDSYSITGVAAGYNQDNWRIKAYVNNLFDSYAFTGGRGAARYGTQGQFFYLTAPRTIGITAGIDF